MTAAPTARTLALAAMVITGSLGAVYLVGWSLSRSLSDSGEIASAPTASVVAHRAGTEPDLADRQDAAKTGAERRAEAQPGMTTTRPPVPTRRPSGAPASGSGAPVPRPDESPTTGMSPTAAPDATARVQAADPQQAANPAGTAAPGGTTAHAAVDRPRLSLQLHGGPYGSRSTTGSHEVALTFDDGPDPRYTPQTLALLRQYQVQATFCLVGENVQRYPDLVRAIVADGHTLCNHSWSHDLSLGRKSRAQIEADLVRTNEAIRQAVPGARIAYFRQPGGNWTPRVVSVAHELDMTPLHWTVDPQDWRLPGAGSISATVTGATFRGAIVLMHDAGGNRQQTVTALRSILPDLTRRFTLAALPNGDPPPDS